MRWPPLRWLVPAACAAFVVPVTATAAFHQRPSGRSYAAGARGVEVLVLDHGRVRARVDPYVPAVELPAAPGSGAVPGPAAGAPPPPRPRPGSAGRARTPAASVSGVLARTLRAGAITQSLYQQYLGDYQAARRSLGRLGGTRRAELGGVVANVQAMAAAGSLTSSRMPAVFLTLARNRQWWTTGPLLSSGQRVGFPGSRLVWEYYAGQGIEIQWLGTFGEANGYFFGHLTRSLRQLLDEIVPLAARRAGGLAWEYLFRFDGGVPPWTSALSQGTGIQALARGAVTLNQPSYLAVAHRALAVFQARPPGGVRLALGSGSFYLIYSFDTGQRVLNGFIQALIGLYDYATLANDGLARQLFVSGDAAARRVVPGYDTGSWSLYDRGTESDLSYHELVRDFLHNLCARTTGRVSAPGLPKTLLAPPATPQPVTPAGGTAPGGGTTGGAPPGPGPGPQPPPPNPAPATPAADGIYCTTASHFTAYTKAKPAISVSAQRLRAGRVASLRFRVSKVSAVALSVVRGGQVVYRFSSQLEHGWHSASWAVPRGAHGSYVLRVAATDLAGNSAVASAPLMVG